MKSIRLEKNQAELSWYHLAHPPSFLIETGSSSTHLLKLNHVDDLGIMILQVPPRFLDHSAPLDEYNKGTCTRMPSGLVLEPHLGATPPSPASYLFNSLAFLGADVRD